MQHAVITQMDRDYCARTRERINALSTQSGPGAKQRLQRVYFLACLIVWTTPTQMHGPFLRIASAAQQGLARG